MGIGVLSVIFSSVSVLCYFMAHILSDADLIMAIIITTATPGNKTQTSNNTKKHP